MSVITVGHLDSGASPVLLPDKEAAALLLAVCSSSLISSMDLAHTLAYGLHRVSAWAVAHLMTLVAGLHEFGFSCPCGHCTHCGSWRGLHTVSATVVAHLMTLLVGLHDFGFDVPLEHGVL